MKLSDEVIKMIEDMNFSTALAFLKQGFKLKRTEWKKDYYIQLIDGKLCAVDDEYKSKNIWDIEDKHVLATDWNLHLGLETITGGNI